jgi:hypothetical protein
MPGPGFEHGRSCPQGIYSQQSFPGNTCKVTGIAVGSPTVAYTLFCGLPEAPPIYRRAGGPAVQQDIQEGFMTRAKKSYRLELTKEQQALVLQKTGMEAKELELTADELKTRAEPKGVGHQP